jgi:hypothetical protein
MTISCISRGLAGFGSQSRPKEASSAFRIRTGIPFEVCDLSYSLLADRSRLLVGSRAGAVVREVVVLSVSRVSPFVPV